MTQNKGNIKARIIMVKSSSSVRKWWGQLYRPCRLVVAYKNLKSVIVIINVESIMII